MEKLVCVLDELVRGLKENTDFAGVRFIHGGRNKPAEKPVVSFLVACGVKNRSVRVLEDGTASRQGVLEFCVYAPAGEGKRGLGILCENMALALENSENKKSISEISVHDAVFDSNLTVWRQSISVKLASSQAAEKSSIPLEVCGKAVQGVTSFSAVCNREYYRVRELLAGDTGERVVQREDYVLSLSVKSSQDIFVSHPEGGISLLLRDTMEEYVNCAVEKSVLRFTPSGTQREYVLIGTRRKAG